MKNIEHDPNEYLKDRLEEVRRMIMDTKAEMAQARNDLPKNPARAQELESLKATLDALESEAEEIEKMLQQGN